LGLANKAGGEPNRREDNAEGDQQGDDRGCGGAAADEAAEFGLRGMGEEGEQDGPRNRDEEGLEHLEECVGDQGQQPEKENLDDTLAVHRIVNEPSRSYEYDLTCKGKPEGVAGWKSTASRISI
jgi:hypothetical protein